MDFNVRPIAKKWFSAATPTNYKPNAIATIETDEDAITVTADNMETDVVIKIVKAATASTAMAVALAEGTITITLGTDATVSPITVDDTLNTAELIVAAITALDGFTATFDLDGEGVIDTVTSEDISFINGNYGTPCMESNICLQSGGTYYVCIEADQSIYNTGWRTFTLANY